MTIDEILLTALKIGVLVTMAVGIALIIAMAVGDIRHHKKIENEKPTEKEPPEHEEENKAETPKKIRIEPMCIKGKFFSGIKISCENIYGDFSSVFIPLDDIDILCDELKKMKKMLSAEYHKYS